MAAIKNDDVTKELKQKMIECEEIYHNSFKFDSCRAIMESYYSWQRAKKEYYTAIGVCRPTNNDKVDNIPDSEEIIDDFNSLI